MCVSIMSCSTRDLFPKLKELILDSGGKGTTKHHIIFPLATGRWGLMGAWCIHGCVWVAAADPTAPMEQIPSTSPHLLQPPPLPPPPRLLSLVSYAAQSGGRKPAAWTFVFLLWLKNWCDSRLGCFERSNYSAYQRESFVFCGGSDKILLSLSSHSQSAFRHLWVCFYCQEFSSCQLHLLSAFKWGDKLLSGQPRCPEAFHTV